MITDQLKEAIATYLATAATPYINSGKIGLGGNSTNPTSTDLDVPIAGVTPSIIRSKSDINVIEVKLSISGSVIQGRVIREVGIFDDGSAQSPTRDDYMLQRVNFEGVGPFATDETLEIFILMEVE